MTPLETLAAARLSPVSPYVPAREEWLDGWCGPLVASVDLYGDILHSVQLRTGEMLGLHEIHFRYDGIVMDANVPLSAIRLDLRRPECRDLLVRRGCPAWARDVPAAVWAWAGGAEIQGCGLMVDAGERPVWLISRGWLLEEADGWYVPLAGGGVGWWPKNLETP